MVSSTSLSIFKCPSCGAPLDPAKNATNMKCPYCGATVIIPESMQTTTSTSTGTLTDVTRLAQESKLEEAAKIYSKITGLSHENAMFSVKSMAGVRDEKPETGFSSPTSTPPTPTYSHPIQTYNPPPYSMPTPTARPRGRSGGCLSGIIRLAVLGFILLMAFPSLWKVLQFQLPTDLPFISGNSFIPAPFSKEVMSFKPSSLKDPRAIALDGNGNIVIYNYNSSEVQVFDPQGNETMIFKATGNDGRDLNEDHMAVTRDGTIYLPGFQNILVFNENAERVREIDNEDLFIIYSVMTGPDDTLYALVSDGLIRMDASGNVNLRITEDYIQSATGDTASIDAMGVDAQGNIYLNGSPSKDILKFSPNGDFIEKFSGDFDSIRQIAFDGYGRIYVVDFFDVKVFDSNYNYINKIDGTFWNVDFDSQGYMYGVTTNSDKVIKFEIQNPTQ